MMVKNVIHLQGEFSIRSQIDIRDASQILTYTLETTRQWNKLILEKLAKSDASDISIHICPWDGDDWKQYLNLGEQVSRLVLWLSDQMQPISDTNHNLQIVQYKPKDYSERFVVVTANGIARALVSWEKKLQAKEETSFESVFVSSPDIARRIAATLDRKLMQDQV
jgi:hypothetical protein